MRKRLMVLLVVAAMGMAVMAVPAAAGPVDTPIPVKVTKAPIAADGTTAGAVSDFVLSFVDLDPGVDGIGIMTGGKIEVLLPDAFVNTGGGVNAGIILQGWQASPRLGSWTTTVSGNTITLDLTSDYLPINEANPGPKQVHLLLNGFENPRPGRYEVGLTITPDGDVPGHTLSGTGIVKIIPRARPSVNLVSVLSGNPGPPPFKNVQHQTVDQGTDPDKVGLYLWDKDSTPFVGVDVVMSNADHYRFVQGGKTVGHVWIDAPAGAGNYTLSTPVGPSTPGFTAVTVLPTAHLITQFSPDPGTIGEYTLTFKMNNGNTQTQFVEVVLAS